jgi:hypothetical protein
MWYFVVFLKHFDLARMRLLKPWRNLGSPFATNQTWLSHQSGQFQGKPRNSIPTQAESLPPS